MSGTKIRNKSSNKLSKRIENPWTGEEKIITANSEQDLEMRIRSQLEKWSDEAHIIQEKNKASFQTSKAQEIKAVISHLCFYAPRFSVKIYYMHTNSCSLHSPDIEEIRQHCKVPSKLRMIIELFRPDLKEDRRTRELRAENEYQEAIREYERASSERERTISFLLNSFTPDNISEIEKYFLYVIHLVEDRISAWLGIIFSVSPSVIYTRDTHSLDITFELPKTEALPREKSWHYFEKEDEVKPEYYSALEQQKLYSKFVYEFALMMIASVFYSDDKKCVNIVHFCGEKYLLDRSYGTEKAFPVIKVTLTRTQFNELNLRYADAYEVWKRIGGEVVSDFSNEIYSKDAIRLINIK